MKCLHGHQEPGRRETGSGNIWGEIMVRDRRVRAVDRRQQQRKLAEVPFKDSNGVTVRDERRFMPDRRVSSIAAESDQQEPKTA